MRVLRFWLGWVLISCCCGLAKAQLNSTRKAWNQLNDRKWESSLRLLKKIQRKDTAHVEANYILSHWFLAPGNPEWQVDSAYTYILKTEHLYRSLPDRDKERLLRFPIDSLIILKQHHRIDSAGFERAKRLHTEESYNRFIELFPGARQIPDAIELRDEVSFLEALKLNSVQSFQDYLNKNPKSHRVDEAQERYDRLLFESKTRDKQLSSYISFVEQFPTSPFVLQAQREILELSTADGYPVSFQNYLNKFPGHSVSKLARDILFHLSLDQDLNFPAELLTDSLQRVNQLNAHFWIPFYKNGLYGFMDYEGEVMLPEQFEKIEAEYKCYPMVKDILTLSSGFYSRSGRKLAEAADTVEELGLGFLAVQSGTCTQVLHKSGARIISSCYQKFKIVGTRLLAGFDGKFWTLFTLTGRKVGIEGMEAVEETEGLLVITRMGKNLMTTVENIVEIVKGGKLKDELVFDEVKAVRAGEIWVRNGSLEGLLNQQLEYIVPLYRQSLQFTPFGWIEKQPVGAVVHGLSSDLENKVWHSVSWHNQWLVLQTEGQFQLYHLQEKKLLPTLADSVWFDQSLAFIRIGTDTRVYFSAARSLELPPDSRMHFIASRDSVRFFYTETKNKRLVFEISTGEQLFMTEFELLESIGSDLFLVAKGNAKGIVDKNGKEVVKVEMDAIIQGTDGYISLLKGRKFGLFHSGSRKQIKPTFDRNLSILDNERLVAFKEGYFGIIDWNGKALSEFEFLEILPWTEAVIWVKKNYQWQLYNYKTHAVVLDRIRDFTWIQRDDREKLVRIHQDNYYGILSNVHGMVIPPTFHDVVNLGTQEIPFYFTEKRVEEAGIYVVIYYNRSGKLVRRQAYEEEEYDQIYCDEK